MQPQGVQLINYVNNGQAWVADSKVTTIGIGKRYLRFLIENNGAKAKRLKIYCFSGWTPLAAGMVMTVYRNPTQTTLATVVPINNQNAEISDTSNATVSTDTSAADFSGGTYYRSIPIVANVPLPQSELKSEIVIVPPGQSLAVSADFGSNLLVAATAIAHLDWIEEYISNTTAKPTV